MKKISLFMLMAVGLLISGNAGAGNQAKIVGGSEYETLTAAIAAVPTDGTQTKIQLIADIEFERNDGSAYAINKSKNVILDLNGHYIKATQILKDGKISTVNVIENSGILEIMDGQSGGYIWFKSLNNGNQHVSTVVNHNKLTVKSGIIQNATCDNHAPYYTTYAIDCISNDATMDVQCEIEGGKIISKGADGYLVPAIRLYDQSGSNVTFTMNGGTVEGQRGIYIQMARKKEITVNINGGILAGYGNTSDTQRPWAIDVESYNTTKGAFNAVEINIKDGTIDGKISLGRNNTGTDLGCEKLDIKGGNFTYHNVILNGHANTDFYEGCPNTLVGCVSGGTFFFSQDATIRTPYVTEIQFASDWGGDYAKGYDDFNKYYGDLANRAGWEALGYTVEKIPTPQSKAGKWYAIVKYTASTQDYKDFLTYIADGYTAVDITGQNDGNGGTWPDKTVEIKQVETKEITSDGELPETKPNDAVVITSSANVTISGEREVYSLNVESGSLTVGADATVIVGAGGVTENSVITVEADGSGMGVFKIDPSYEMTEENRPTISVDLYTKARTVDGVSYWQFFARPTGVTPTAFYPTDETSGLATIHNIYGWDAAAKEYVPILNKEGLNKSFTGYAISNNSTDGGVVYHFEGKLNENENGKLPMTNSGFNLVGNSYIAPVALKEMLASIAGTEGLGDKVELSIWYYDSDNGSFKAVTSLRSKDYQLQPLQGFFMYNMSNGAIDNAQIDYLNAVWNNNKPAGPLPAPAHGDVAQMTMAQIIVSANGNADIVEVFEDAQFSADFDNGADASKLMNPSGMFNLYSSDNLASVATDNLDGVQLTFKANDASTYTMSFNEVAGDSFMILDKETGIYTTISNSETYTFQAQPNTTYADRFCLVAGHKAPTNATKVEANKSTKGIYSIMGQYFGTNRNALPAGVYIENGQKIVK